MVVGNGGVLVSESGQFVEVGSEHRETTNFTYDVSAK